LNGDHINIAPSNKFDPISSVIVTGEVESPDLLQ